MRLNNPQRLFPYFALALLGGGAALGQAPWGLWWFSLPALALALGHFGTEEPGHVAFARGWALGLGYFGVALHWIVFPFFVEPEIYGWLSPFAFFGMAGGMALFWGAGSWLAQKTQTPFALWIAAAEVVRAHVLSGFPWASLGHIWIGTPLAQIAALTGPHGLTIITVGFAAGLSVLRQPNRRLWSIVPLLALPVLWVALDPGPAPADPADAPIVRLVQPNVPQDQKWNPAYFDTFYQRFLTETARSPAPSMIVWPESALPSYLEQTEHLFGEIATEAGGAPVVFGINSWQDNRVYNALVVLDATAEISARYEKRHLVPFGEYVPGGGWLERIGVTRFSPAQGGGFSFGREAGSIAVPNIGLVLPLICYEGIFAEEIRARLQGEDRPRALLLVTNDAWFGPQAGPKQHLAQAQLRAIESRLPLVRVANTGVSAMIDTQGRLLGHLPMNTMASLDVALPVAGEPTLYLRFGDWPVLLLLILSLILPKFTKSRN